MPKYTGENAEFKKWELLFLDDVGLAWFLRFLIAATKWERLPITAA